MTSISIPKASELKSCLVNGFKSFRHLKQAHARLFRLGLDQENHLLNTLLGYCFQFGKTNYSNLIFNHTLNPNIFLYNTMIRGFVSGDLFEDSIRYYRLMRSNDVLPNSFTCPFVLKACARILDYDLGFQIHNIATKLGFDTDSFLEMGFRPEGPILVQILSACAKLGEVEIGEWIHRYINLNAKGKNIMVDTSLIDMYAKSGQMEKARAVFDEMPEKDVVSWTAMIQGYVANGFPKEALDIFFEMQTKNIRPDSYTLVGVLSACTRLGAMDSGEQAISSIDRKELVADPVLGTALIDMYAKCGNMNQAWRVFAEMKDRDIVVWNAAIDGLSINGYVEIAFALFVQMEKLGIHPNGNIFLSLLCGCTHAGLVYEGRKYFNSMEHVFALTPTIEHYGCMVDLLSRAGLLREAHHLIQSMPMEPNVIVWGALLGGCRLHRNTHLAEHALEQLVQLEPWNSSNYVLLSNIYSANNKWCDAERIRAKMSEQGIQKIPGFSWIEVDGNIHEFVVGDKSHPLSDQIYVKLAELLKDLRAVGYVPTTDFVLFDVEEEEKENFLGYHSEKLAIAFGLISTPSDHVIRVVKNLRVCGDCHAAIKIISRVTGREIVVRDTNRFHCFVDGASATVLVRTVQSHAG
ncbi:hypothetical protein Cgig2_000116 [Carnegiea gigantea]|uniref:DYW domain-containing protein n=1 Tax=Carnegiea gigantea TaxID=171969 RepID=A0A9Q1KZC2_9CARY|nr:hypothetical protein Cgig2_000116 [Carnegiea gigantea]